MSLSATRSGPCPIGWIGDGTSDAILGIGGVQRRLELSASGALVEAEWLGLSLTFDHRVLDGALAADVLDDLVSVLEATPEPEPGP